MWPIRSTNPDGQDIRSALRANNIQIVKDMGALLKILLPDGLEIQFPADGSNPLIVLRDKAEEVVLIVCYPEEG